MKASNRAANLILVDADYIDSVAFDITVNFERVLGRRIPPADLCRWLDCIALDGGLLPGDNSLSVVFLRSAKMNALSNFTPGDFAAELNGRAFRDNLGEFALSAFPVEETLVTKAGFFVDVLNDSLAAAEVERIMVVADMAAYGADVKRACAAAKGKDVTLFGMEPLSGRGFSSEILGYSLMSALGIRAEELEQ